MAIDFYVTKCTVLSFGEKTSEINYFVCNQRLKNVDTHSYLGVELQSNIKWEAKYYKITSKVSRISFMLRRVQKHAATKTRKISHFSLVRPILEYGCIVWSPFSKKNIKKFEKIQNTALMFIVKLKGQVSLTEIRENTSIESLAKRRKVLRSFAPISFSKTH